MSSDDNRGRLALAPARPTRWSTSAATSILLVDLGRDPGAERVLYRGLGDQRRHVRHVPVGVGHLVRRPHAEHRHRGEHAAERDRPPRPPARASGRAAPYPRCAALLRWPARRRPPCSRSSRTSARSRSSSRLVVVGRSVASASLGNPGVSPRRPPASWRQAPAGGLRDGGLAGRRRRGRPLPPAAPATLPGSRLSSDIAQPSRRSLPAQSSCAKASRSLASCSLERLVLISSASLCRELFLDPVDHRVGAEQEQRRRARGDLVAHGLDERVVDADVGERAEQRAGGGADREPDERHEEDQAEQQPPEAAAERAALRWCRSSGGSSASSSPLPS